MADPLQVHRNQIEIRIGDVPLVAKLDALGAAVAAVRDAHGDTMSKKAWAAMHRAQNALAEAMLSLNDTGMVELPAAKPRLHHGR